MESMSPFLATLSQASGLEMYSSAYWPTPPPFPPLPLCGDDLQVIFFGCSPPFRDSGPSLRKLNVSKEWWYQGSSSKVPRPDIKQGYKSFSGGSVELDSALPATRFCPRIIIQPNLHLSMHEIYIFQLAWNFCLKQTWHSSWKYWKYLFTSKRNFLLMCTQTSQCCFQMTRCKQGRPFQYSLLNIST